MPVEQLTDRVILKHPKVLLSCFLAEELSETGRRVLL